MDGSTENCVVYYWRLGNIERQYLGFKNIPSLKTRDTKASVDNGSTESCFVYYLGGGTKMNLRFKGGNICLHGATRMHLLIDNGSTKNCFGFYLGRRDGDLALKTSPLQQRECIF